MVIVLRVGRGWSQLRLTVGWSTEVRFPEEAQITYSVAWFAEPHTYWKG